VEHPAAGAAESRWKSEVVSLTPAALGDLYISVGGIGASRTDRNGGILLSRVSAESGYRRFRGRNPFLSAKSRTRPFAEKGEAPARLGRGIKPTGRGKLMLTAASRRAAVPGRLPLRLRRTDDEPFFAGIAVARRLPTRDSRRLLSSGVSCRARARLMRQARRRPLASVGWTRLCRKAEPGEIDAKAAGDVFQHSYETRATLSASGRAAGRWRRPSLDRPSSAPCCCAISRTESNA